jgi:hypothetical protein
MIRSRKRSSSNDLPLAVWATVNFIFLSLLAVLAVLREQAMFWKNAGGWPPWLRDFVAASFYPLLSLELLLLLAYTSACLGSLRSHHLVGRTAIIALPALWVLLFFVLGIVAANNLDNLLSGRPLHWHAE